MRGTKNPLGHKRKYKKRDHYSGDKPIEAYCPRCRRKHVISLYWTGNGIPRIYCLKCQKIIDGESGLSEENGSGFYKLLINKLAKK